MILSEVFGENIWVIPNGKNHLTLIDLPESKDSPIFGTIKNRGDFGLLMAFLIPNAQFSLEESQLVLNMLYRVGRYKTRAEIFKLIRVKGEVINGINLMMYKAAIFSPDHIKEDPDKLFRDQLICEMSEAYAQKQMMNLEIRFGEFFEFIKSQKTKNSKKKPAILLV